MGDPGDEDDGAARRAERERVAILAHVVPVHVDYGRTEIVWSLAAATLTARWYAEAWNAYARHSCF